MHARRRQSRRPRVPQDRCAKSLPFLRRQARGHGQRVERRACQNDGGKTRRLPRRAHPPRLPAVAARDYSGRRMRASNAGRSRRLACCRHRGRSSMRRALCPPRIPIRAGGRGDGRRAAGAGTGGRGVRRRKSEEVLLVPARNIGEDVLASRADFAAALSRRAHPHPSRRRSRRRTPKGARPGAWDAEHPTDILELEATAPIESTSRISRTSPHLPATERNPGAATAPQRVWPRTGRAPIPPAHIRGSTSPARDSQRRPPPPCSTPCTGHPHESSAWSPH